jgi:DnaJ-class molecular chaperone
MAMQWHPDRPHNREKLEEATEKFQTGKQAYDNLLEDHRLMVGR